MKFVIRSEPGLFPRKKKRLPRRFSSGRPAPLDRLPVLRFRGWDKEVRDLYLRQERAERKLRRNEKQITQALCQETVNRLLARKDQQIRSAYLDPAGIRFYAQLLQTRLDAADSGHSTPEELVELVYDGTLKPLRMALLQLQARCARIDRAIQEPAPSALPGFQYLLPRIKELSWLWSDVDQLLLQEAVTQNEVVLKAALDKTKHPLPQRKLGSQPLLDTMNDLFSSSQVRRFSLPGDPGEYLEDLKAYAGRVRRELLDRTF